MVKGDFKTLAEAHDKLSSFYEENKDAVQKVQREQPGSESDRSVLKDEESKADESFYALKQSSLSRLPEFKKVGSIAEFRNAIQDRIIRYSNLLNI